MLTIWFMENWFQIFSMIVIIVGIIIAWAKLSTKVDGLVEFQQEQKSINRDMLKALQDIKETLICTTSEMKLEFQKELQGKTDSMQEKINGKFGTIQESVSNKFDTMQENINSRFGTMQENINVRFDTLTESLTKVRESVAKLEGRLDATHIKSKDNQE